MNPILIDKFLPDDILNLIYSYCIMKYGKKKVFDRSDWQSKSLICETEEPLMDTLLDMSTSVIERNVGKKLWPTYSFFRIYDRESDLFAHLDRNSCEYTVALCLGSDPKDKPYDIFLGEKDDTSDYKYYNRERELIGLRIENKFSMLPNNALIFKGMKKLHWREPCTHDHYITVFLHYVDQEGPHAEWKFDKRKSLL